MLYEEAVYEAEMYTQVTGKEAFVYWDNDNPDGFDWCNVNEYTYNWHRRERNIVFVYSTLEGRYV